VIGKIDSLPSIGLDIDPANRKPAKQFGQQNDNVTGQLHGLSINTRRRKLSSSHLVYFLKVARRSGHVFNFFSRSGRSGESAAFTLVNPFN